MDQLKAVQALFNTENLSRPPQPFPRSVVPAMNQNGTFSYPNRPFVSMMPPPPFGQQSRSALADNVFLSPNNAGSLGPGGFAGSHQYRFSGAGGGVGQQAPRRPIVLQPHAMSYQHQAVSYTGQSGTWSSFSR
jgi:hypothetical protein